MRLILIMLLAAAAWPSAATAQDSAKVVRRIANTARLAAEEYRLGVAGGKIVLEPEVEEARLFLLEARRAADQLPSGLADSTARALEAIQQLVASVGAPDSVAASVERIVSHLARTLAIELDEIPESTPALARGAAVYRQACASCHGVVGRGDGPAAPGLDPAPANLADQAVLSGATPLDFYRRITTGVAGTAMPAYETILSPADRWAAALYASTLRLPPARGPVPAPLASFPVTARLSDADLADSLGGAGLERVAAARVAGLEAGRDYGAVFATVRSAIDSTVALAQGGQPDRARSQALDAYMAFEAVERELRVKDPGLVLELERGFADLREIAAGRTGDVSTAGAGLTQALDRAERAVGANLSAAALFVQSLLILLREGLEAILVVGALVAFLAKLGAGHRRRELHLGVGAAIVLSLLTAIAIETVFRISPANQEALEAGTMVLATIMLFWVSYWLLSKIEVARWNQFVKSKLSEALGRRSSLALASVAFLAVYREGFETVLFYKALVVSGGGGPVALPIGLGIVVASVVLTAVYIAVNRFGVRLPLRPFFAVTSAFLYAMAFNFAGTAIAELQEGGFVSLTPVEWLPRIPMLGMYPTLESALAQALLLALAAAALAWTFLVTPRRALVPPRAPAAR